MDISVELTLTPLADDYEPPIIALIKALRASGLKILETPLSTQVFGPYDQVMKVLVEEIKPALEQSGKALLYMKIVTTDRSDYEPHF